MEEHKLLASLLFVLVGLSVGAFLKIVLKKTIIPYTVGLFGFGIIVGLCERSGSFNFLPFLNEVFSISGSNIPDMVMYVFLPILIFDAAYSLDTHIFKKTLGNATLLAVPGVALCMVLTAAMMVALSYLFPTYSIWSWNTALMFGALISATDPVAVVALLKELGTSKRFSTLVDAESMLNDGTGIVFFMLFLTILTGGTVSTSPYIEFVRVIAGGVILGYFAARITVFFIKRFGDESIVQNSVIILAAYITFILAQAYLDVSGVIALVVFGLSMTYYGNPKIKPQVVKFTKEFWELSAYIANTIIFIIVGMIIAMSVTFSWHNWIILFIIYIGITLIRALMVFCFLPAMRKWGYGLGKREAVILSWGGLRGALGLTLALVVSYNPNIQDTIRGQILFLTAGIVTLTLLVNATTVRWFLTKLGLNKTPSSKQILECTVKTHISEESEKYLTVLKTKESLSVTDWNIVEQFLPPKCEEVADESNTDITSNLRLKILEHEKSSAWNLFNDGIISLRSLRKINASVDILYDRNGQLSLADRGKIFNFAVRSRWEKLLRKVSFIKKIVDHHFHQKLVEKYDLARGWILVQNGSLQFIGEFNDSTTLTDMGKDCLPKLKEEVVQSIEKAQAFIDNMQAEYPRSYKYAVTQKAVRMLLRKEKAIINQFMQQGLLSDDEAERLENSVGNQNKLTNYSSLRKMGN